MTASRRRFSDAQPMRTAFLTVRRVHAIEEVAVVEIQKGIL